MTIAAMEATSRDFVQVSSNIYLETREISYLSASLECN